MSAEMVAAVTGYLEDAYLIYTVEIFSLNTSVRKTNPKKVYCADHALALAMSGSMTDDYGKVLENIIFMQLRRETDKIYYGKTPSGYEIDFVTLERGQQISGDRLPRLVQVCADMDEPETRERELRALQEGMSLYGVKNAEIVAENLELSLNDNACYGREGMVGKRPKDEIGIHAVRGGDIVGDHTVMFCGDGERIEVIHRASTRQAFVNGVIRAINFLMSKQDKPVADMFDVLGL